jgi:hypothetical protein
MDWTNEKERTINLLEKIINLCDMHFALLSQEHDKTEEMVIHIDLIIHISCFPSIPVEMHAGRNMAVNCFVSLLPDSDSSHNSRERHFYLMVF